MRGVSGDLLERCQPQNLEAEAAVLGSIMLDNAAIWHVDGLRPEHFYKTSHGTVFGAMLALADEQTPIDAVSLPARLRRDGKLDPIGGEAFLSSLLKDAAPSAANVAHHAALVKDRAELRAWIAVASELLRDAYDADASARAIVDRAEAAIVALVSREQRDAAPTLASLVEAEAALIASGDKPRLGLPFGLIDLDELVSLRDGELTILAARPSHGKTSLAVGAILHNALHQVPAVLFSLEMAARQIAQNILGGFADVAPFRIARGRLTGEDRSRVGGRWRDLAPPAAATVIVDDAGTATITALRARARHAVMRHHIKLVVVDYLQLVSGSAASNGRRHDNRTQEVGEVSRGLKAMAKELGVPVLALCQLNREVEARQPPVPRLSDLREAGSIEQDADVVLLLWREGAAKRDKPELAHKAQVVVAKHRNGPTGLVNLHWDGERMQFKNEGVTR